MRRLFLKLLHFLDGTPAVYGQRQSGQSLVEMALITPILIVMFMGMVEIGWFANNYMTLLDVTRSGARRAAVLQDQFSPLEWDNRASGVPLATGFLENNNDYNTQGLALSGAAGVTQFRMPFINVSEAAIEESWRQSQRACGRYADASGTVYQPMFYQQVVCVMLSSLDPLELDGENSIDDIVVSGFSLARITDPISTAITMLPQIAPQPTNGSTRIMVVGRYPTNANECEILNTGTLSAPAWSLVTAGQTGAFDYRDPFDIDNDQQQDVVTTSRSTQDQNGQNINERRNEVNEFDAASASLATAERQVGFVWFGQHWIRAQGLTLNNTGTGCLGSEFPIAVIEQIVNLPVFNTQSGVEDPATRELYPHQGLVLVELFWEHEMLLKFPVFNPVVGAFAGDTTPTISVWAAFPMPSVEPNNASLGLDADPVP